MKREKLTDRFLQRSLVNVAKNQITTSRGDTSWMKSLGLMLSLFVYLYASVAFAAVHYIRAGANGNGSSWATAFPDIPATLVRGDTYYIASGSYGSHTFPTLAGTSYVYLKKATQAVNGSDPGWDPSYGTGEALFSSSGTVWTINMAYLDVDGMYGTGTSQHGIHLSSSTTTEGAGAIVVTYGINPPQSHVWLRHLEMNNGPWGNGNSSGVLYHRSSTTVDWNIQYCYVHGGRVGIWFGAGGSSQNLIEYCVIKDCGSDDSALHCEMIGLASANNSTVRYNVLWNMQGRANTTYIEPQFSGSGLYIYGNVFREDAGVTGTGSGIMAITSTDQWQDVRIYNNTAYNLHCSASLLQAGNYSGSAVYIANNIFQNCTVSGYADVAGNIKQNVNNIINSSGAAFVNAASGNFHLSTPTQNGLALGAPYNIDPDGNLRGAGGVWDIGAYEYGVASTNPVISVVPTSLNFGSVPAGTSRDLSFTLQNAGAGILAGTGSVTAPFFIVSNGTYTLGAGQSQVVTVRYSPTNAGSVTQTATFTGGGGASPTVSGLAFAALPAGLSFEYYAGTITSPFVTNSGGYLSQDIMTGVADGGRAVYLFTVTNAGSYVIQALVNAPDLTANSYFVNVDAEPLDPTMAWDILPPTTGFEPRIIGRRGNGTADDNQFDRQIFDLTAGTHQLIIVGREPNTQLSSLSLLKLPPRPPNFRLVSLP